MVSTDILCSPLGAKTPCDNYFCPIGFRCQLKENKEPYCECNVECDADSMIGPVCAKTGKTYPHMCALKKNECSALSFIPVDFYGDCNNRVGQYVCCYVQPTFNLIVMQFGRLRHFKWETGMLRGNQLQNQLTQFCKRCFVTDRGLHIDLPRTKEEV